MKVVAKTENAYLIEASLEELNAIITAVNGKKPDKIEIGNKIPAIDYAGTISKIKSLRDNYEFKKLLEYAETFMKNVSELDTIVTSASNLEV